MKPLALIAVAAALLAGAPCLSGLCPVPAALAQDPAPPPAPAKPADAPAKDAAKTTTFHFLAGSRTTITFHSDTDLETIHGSTQTMSGTATFDFDKGTGSTTLTVPVAHMKTGQALRDEHMRSEQWLHAEKHPDITFEAKKLERKETKGKVETWAYEGSLTIKGVTKDLKGEAKVSRIPPETGRALGEGDWVKVSTEFPVTLADFAIEVPKNAAAKVNPTWDVKISIFGTTEAPKRKQ